MPTAMTVAQLAAIQETAVLKFHNGAAFFADTTAPHVTSLFDSSGNFSGQLPAGYYSGGGTDASGLTISRAISMTDANIWQSTEPVRSDKTADKRQIKVKLSETTRVSQALQESVPISAITWDGTPLQIDHDPYADEPERRVLLLAQDTTRNIIFARYFPRVKVTAFADQSMQRATEYMYDLTFDAYKDNTFGTSSCWFAGGTGWAGLVAAGTTITVTPTTATLSLAGVKTQQLAVTSGATNVTGSATFVSSNPAVATVNSSGLVTGVSAGTATVTSSYAGATATTAVTVTA